MSDNTNKWFCRNCACYVDPCDVTFTERHDERNGGCGLYLQNTSIPDPAEIVLRQRDELARAVLEWYGDRPTVEGMADACNRMVELAKEVTDGQ